jgi:threonine synthase
MSIWKHREIKKTLSNDIFNFITDNEGNTPTERIEVDKGNILFIKREDKNPTGSWKDRGTAFSLTKLIGEGIEEAIISSSGNAAISYLTYISKFDAFKLHVVVSPNTNKDKLTELEKLVEGTEQELVIDEKARSKAASISAKNKIPNLKASADDSIVSAYWSLGFELFDEIIDKNRDKNVVIFTPVSSGTATVGMAQGLLLRINNEFSLPKIIMCQTSSCHPLIENFDGVEEKSLADAIVDKTLLRRYQLENILKQTNGEAIVITNAMLENALQFSKEHEMDLSYTSLLSVAGFLQFQDKHSDTIFITIASGK